MSGWRWGGLVLLVFVLPACGGSSSRGGGATGSCGSAACGGDLTGTWNAQKACFTGTMTQSVQGCSDPSTTTIQNATVSGTLTFDMGGTWTSALNETTSGHLAVGQSCITSATDCSQVETSLKQQSGITAASCSFVNNCACDFSTATTDAHTGTYQINGTSVVMTMDGSTSPPATDGFCVAGNTLTLSNSAGGPLTSLVFSR